MVKTGSWGCADAETRKPGEQTGLDTPVVLALNGAHWVWEGIDPFRAEANALSEPPGEYGRKTKTQRN